MPSSTAQRIEFFSKIAIFYQIAAHRGVSLLPFSFIRDALEQNQLFKEGKSKCDGYIKISKHQKALALDFVIVRGSVKYSFKDGKTLATVDEIIRIKSETLDWKRSQEYEMLGKIWEELGGTWGGRWRADGKTSFDDIYHYEL